MPVQILLLITALSVCFCLRPPLPGCAKKEINKENIESHLSILSGSLEISLNLSVMLFARGVRDCFGTRFSTRSLLPMSKSLLMSGVSTLEAALLIFAQRKHLKHGMSRACALLRLTQII